MELRFEPRQMGRDTEVVCLTRRSPAIEQDDETNTGPMLDMAPAVVRSDPTDSGPLTLASSDTEISLSTDAHSPHDTFPARHELDRTEHDWQIHPEQAEKELPTALEAATEDEEPNMDRPLTDKRDPTCKLFSKEQEDVPTMVSVIDNPDPQAV